MISASDILFPYLINFMGVFCPFSFILWYFYNELILFPDQTTSLTNSFILLDAALKQAHPSQSQIKIALSEIHLCPKANFSQFAGVAG